MFGGVPQKSGQLVLNDKLFFLSHCGSCKCDLKGCDKVDDVGMGGVAIGASTYNVELGGGEVVHKVVCVAVAAAAAAAAAVGADMFNSGPQVRHFVGERVLLFFTFYYRKVLDFLLQLEKVFACKHV